MKRLVERTLRKEEDIVPPSKEELIEHLPYIVGFKSGKVKLSFRRLLIGFTDSYDIKMASQHDGIRVVLDGEKSRIVVEVKREGSKAVALGEYKGPRGWIVKSRLPELAKGVMEASIREVHADIEASAAPDVSLALSTLSSLTRIVSKSMLVATEHIVLRGDALEQVRKLLASKGLLEKYRTLYVSGAGMGIFRLVLADNKLVGVYVKAGGQDYIGDPQALSLLEGLFTIKVYALLEPLEEVLAH